MSPISILMVDDHPVVREGYSRLLERGGEFRVCSQADNAARAYQLYKEHQPDVVIMEQSGGTSCACTLDRSVFSIAPSSSME
jgi:two-component system, NarL family, invasion response regulator UvrY